MTRARYTHGVRIAAVVVLLLISSHGLAQPAPSPAHAQIFGGYSHLLLDSVAGQRGGHGIAGGVTVSLNRYFGLTLDVDSHTFWSPSREQDIRSTYLSGGPRVSLRFERFTPFGFVTVDGQWTRYSTGRVFNETSMTYIPCCGGSASAWGLGYGGGLDLSLTRRFAIRALQWNQSLGGFGQGPGLESRLKAGIVIGID